jgi:hypothetical protein
MGNFNKEGQVKVQGSFSKRVAKEVFAMKHFQPLTKI